LIPVNQIINKHRLGEKTPSPDKSFIRIESANIYIKSKRKPEIPTLFKISPSRHNPTIMHKDGTAQAHRSTHTNNFLSQKLLIPLDPPYPRSPPPTHRQKRVCHKTGHQPVKRHEETG
jgi:hypothetical protein